MECPAPYMPGILLPGDLTGPAEHLRRGPAGEREQQDAIGRDTLLDQVGNPTRQCPRLAGSRTGYDQQGPVTVCHGLLLRRIKLIQPRTHPSAPPKVGTRRESRPGRSRMFHNGWRPIVPERQRIR